MTYDLSIDVAVGLAFMLQVYNYWLVGRGIINRWLFAAVLILFCIAEGLVALERPSYWLFVALNLWGLACVAGGRRI